MTWLKNWTRGAQSRRSEMDMTELSFISSANLSASFAANNDTSGMENDNDTNPFTMMTTTTTTNEKMVPPSSSAANGDEQDLSGFDEELGEETTITTTPVSSSASPLRKFNTSEVKRSLSTTSYLSPIGECSTPELANNRAGYNNRKRRDERRSRGERKSVSRTTKTNDNRLGIVTKRSERFKKEKRRVDARPSNSKRDTKRKPKN